MPVTSNKSLLKSARREAVWTLAVWLGTLTYTVGYCARYGYDRKPDDLTFVLGFPDWVFWGIVVPWGVCYLISALFAFVLIEDAVLADDAGDVDRDDSSQPKATGT
jgi:hypothetical protein